MNTCQKDKKIRSAGNLKNPSKKSEIRVKRVPDSFLVIEIRNIFELKNSLFLQVNIIICCVRYFPFFTHVCLLLSSNDIYGNYNRRKTVKS